MLGCVFLSLSSFQFSREPVSSDSCSVVGPVYVCVCVWLVNLCYACDDMDVCRNFAQQLCKNAPHNEQSMQFTCQFDSIDVICCTAMMEQSNFGKLTRDEKISLAFNECSPSNRYPLSLEIESRNQWLRFDVSEFHSKNGWTANVH